MVEKKRYVCVGELAPYLGTTVNNLYKLVSQRRIPFTKIGRSVRFDTARIEEWLAQQSVEPEQW